MSCILRSVGATALSLAWPTVRLLSFLGLTLTAAAPACITSTVSAGTPDSPVLAPADPAPDPLEVERRLSGIARVDLLGPKGMAAFALQGETRKVAITTVSVQGQPFAAAMRATISESSGSEWSVQLVAANVHPIEKGDAILATFYLRAPSPLDGTSLGQTEFVFELGRAPFSKSVQYPIHAGGEWTKVQVPFSAAQAYAIGEAHLIFRLGYDVQTIELGGVTVEGFGKRVSLGSLPATKAADRQRERAGAAAVLAAEEAARTAPPVDGGEIEIEVAPRKIVRPISPFVYGINAQKTEDSGATLRRMGGNRSTGYNWETNASNAGSDYHHNSDEWACSVLGYSDCDVPAAQVLNFAAANRRDGLETLVTVPLVDYVAADKKGRVQEDETAPSPRWAKSLPKKPARFAETPELSDGAVYQDEFVNHLISKVGNAKTGGVRFYALDNEPALWPHTHPRIHGARTTYSEMVSRTEAAAAAITDVDRGALVLGGVMFGWSEYVSLGDAPDAQTENAKLGPEATYIDFFLAQMKRLEAVHHRRLVHALDVHWYPEARGSKRITEKDVSAKTVAARLQAPRSLWDATYLEKSWIAAAWGKPIRLIPWLRERIAARYPGTKLAITEYDFGAGDHISGGLAQVDALGVFGREGVDVANYWGDGGAVGKLPTYVKAAFQLYRNYDGKGGTFGDTAVAATSRDQEKVSVFAATDSKRGRALSVVVINKATHASYAAKVKLDLPGATSGKAPPACVNARVYLLDSSGPSIKALPPVALANGAINHRLPPLSATLFVCEGK